MILALRILYFEDLSVGMTETLSKTISSSDVVVAELIPERQRARLACSCRVGDEIVLDGEAWVKVPSAAKSKRPLPRV